MSAAGSVPSWLGTTVDVACNKQSFAHDGVMTTLLLVALSFLLSLSAAHAGKFVYLRCFVEGTFPKVWANKASDVCYAVLKKGDDSRKVSFARGVCPYGIIDVATLFDDVVR